MPRKTKQFNELLLRYEATPIASRSEIFWEMKRKAKSFSDWAAVYQYGGDDVRKEAQHEMEKLVLRGRKKTDVQLNIWELFLIIDQSDQQEVLEKYLKKHHQKEDFVFALSCADESDVRSNLYAELDDYYEDFDDLERELCKYRTFLSQESTFNPWCGNPRGGREGKTLSAF